MKFFSFLILFSGAAFGQSFKYELEHLPPVGSCHETAIQLAKEVSAHLTSPAKGYCVSIEKSGFDIQIEYEAEKELSIPSTYSKFSLIYDFSAYATKAECDRALVGSVVLFERNTGLKPLVAYCFNQHPDAGFELNWGIRIDAIGTATKRPVTTGLLLGGSPKLYPAATFAETVKKEFPAIDFSHALFRYRSSEYQLDLVYYTDGPKLSSREAAAFTRWQDCEGERAEAQKIYTALHLPKVFLFCTTNYVHGSDLMGIFSSALPPSRLSAERFASYSDCAANRQEMIKTYQGLGYPNIVGGLCTLDRTQYRVSLISSAK